MFLASPRQPIENIQLDPSSRLRIFTKNPSSAREEGMDSDVGFLHGRGEGE